MRDIHVGMGNAQTKHDKTMGARERTKPLPIPRHGVGREGLRLVNYKSFRIKTQFKYILKGFLSSMVVDGEQREDVCSMNS